MIFLHIVHSWDSSLGDTFGIELQRLDQALPAWPARNAERTIKAFRTGQNEQCAKDMRSCQWVENRACASERLSFLPIRVFDEFEPDVRRQLTHDGKVTTTCEAVMPRYDYHDAINGSR